MVRIERERQRAEETDYIIENDNTTISPVDIQVSKEATMSEFASKLESICTCEFSSQVSVSDDVFVTENTGEKNTISIVLYVIEYGVTNPDIKVNGEKNTTPYGPTFDDETVYEWFVENDKETLFRE